VRSCRQFLTLAALVGMAMLGVWWLQRPQGPTYQGRDVRGWLLIAANEYVAANLKGNGLVAVSPRVLTAFRAMGTNATPLLVDAALTARAEPLGGRIMDWLDQDFPALASEILNTQWVWLSSGEVQTVAWDALESLQPPADLLFPLVTNRLRNSNGVVNDAAMSLLLCAGDEREAVARRLAPLISTEPLLAAQLLKQLGPDAVVVLPQLVASLGTPDKEARLETVHCLGAIGAGASNALPALRTAFEAESKTLPRLHIAKAAWKIGAPGFWADHDICEALGGTNRPLRLEVIRLLSDWTNISPRFEVELGALACRTANECNPDWREPLASVVLNTLYSANLDRTRMIPLLNECIQSTNPCVRLNATDKLLELVPTNALAFSSLTNLLSDRRFERVYWYYPYRKVQRRLVDIAAVNGPARSFLRTHRIRMPEDLETEVKALLKAHAGEP
jgi:hypothetical protein